MNHLQVSGEHWDIGFQWGSLLAQRGILIWERIPFPLTPERKAFAQRCRPIYQTFLHSEKPRLPFQESLKERGASLSAAVLFLSLSLAYLEFLLPFPLLALAGVLLAGRFSCLPLKG